ncbi:MAG: MFS transporter [Bulleidia sp.]|jgi:UMF1 family MFS transporter|nr:MFS transporter [Erysipelotrichaceae bacterium 7770_A6]MCI7723762.1 MFS transporter [Erysipelotrichaceae bacterium]MDD7057975.1 MFS transporter [Erysipelotrichaceae bacterium]MDY3661223.1 MFS transporter [Bulleidia sp.]MEE0559115.1 MFS transporter [Bulleidia sp.]
MFKNFNKLEKSWIYYDIGNSAFTMMVSTIIPIWFNTLAANAGMSNSEYLAFWSYATSIATILVAIIGPVFGSIADNKDFKKPMFMFVLFVGVIGCALLGAVPNWILYLITYVIAKICYQTSLVFYDSMLTDVTTPERMDLVSSQGYAWGYIGSCIPFVIALGLYAAGNPDFLGIMNERLSIFLAFIVIAVWWFCVTIPLLKNYKQKYYVETTSNKVKESISRLGKTLVTMYRDEKKVFFFLLAFFFYIDGVYTIIDEAVAIGTALGLNQMGLLVILLLTQVVAFAFATLFGKLSEKYSSVQLITVCILGYFAVAIYALFMKELWQFGIMAFVVGMFQGAIQALSRSYFAQIIPANASGEYFGIYDICGKGAAFMGTTLVGITVSITNSVNVAVATLTVLFILGLFFFRIATKEDK